MKALWRKLTGKPGRPWGWLRAKARRSRTAIRRKLTEKLDQARGWLRAKARVPWTAILQKLTRTPDRLIGTAVVALIIIVLLLVFVPKCQTASIWHDTTRLEREDTARRTLAQIIGGVVVLAGAGIAWWRLRVAQEELKVTREGLQVAREELRVAQEGQVTERFSRAIEHLGNKESLDVRVGAIYALERIARDSRQDHGPIMEILTAYVREHAPWNPPPEDQQPADDEQPLATDIQAVLTVIGRRNTDYDPPGQRLDLRETDLRGADLDKANLQGALLAQANLLRAGLRDAQLNGAELGGANLQGAIVGEAQLQGAILWKAQLQGANLLEANLKGARLTDAKLQRATLVRADLQKTILSVANLQEALLMRADLADADLQWAILDQTKLQGADLSKTIGLTSQQVEEAFGDEHTKLPPGVERPGHWPIEREGGE